MTGKSKKGAAVSQGKNAGAGAVPKPKQESDEANQVVEVTEEQKATAADEVKAAPPPEASTKDIDNSEEAGQQPENKPSEADAEAIAEKLLAEARKPLKKNSSQSSLAGSVTVCIAAVCSNVCLYQAFLQADMAGTPRQQALCALQETELDRFQVPEDAAAEEDQLRAAREAKEKQQIKVRTAAVHAI